LFACDGAGELGRDYLERNLRVSIRISSECYDFLTKWGESPPGDEIDSIITAIGSGAEIGGFFEAANLLDSLDRPGSSHRFSWEISNEYPAIRRAYLRLFPELLSEKLQTPELTSEEQQSHDLTISELQFIERLDCLLVLCEIQLMFLASNFRLMVGTR
jgi:hypothetical protein